MNMLGTCPLLYAVIVVNAVVVGAIVDIEVFVVDIVDVAVEVDDVVLIVLFAICIIELWLSIGLVKFTNFTSYMYMFEEFAKIARFALLLAINVVLYTFMFEELANMPLP